MSGMSGDIPDQLATRLPDWSVSGLLRCSAARFVRVSRTTCCQQGASILVAYASSDTSDMPDFIRNVARMSRECYEKTAPVKCQLIDAKFSGELCRYAVSLLSR